MKKRAKDIGQMKGKTKIISLTSYTYNTAVLTDEVADIILVGDSLGMVLYGYKSTTQVSLEQMIYHGESVARACKNALVVVDMPFGSYEESPQFAFENAAKIIKNTGCDAVKFEGGVEMYDTIKFLTQRGIPVMAHVGLMPQRINTHGSYKKIQEDEYVLKDAQSVEDAGAFCVVLENITPKTATYITQNIKIPTIGIGAGNETDGQIAVLEDICGLSLFQPPFANKICDANTLIKDAINKYRSL